MKIEDLQKSRKLLNMWENYLRLLFLSEFERHKFLSGNLYNGTSKFANIVFRYKLQFFKFWVRKIWKTSLRSISHRTRKNTSNNRQKLLSKSTTSSFLKILLENWMQNFGTLKCDGAQTGRYEQSWFYEIVCSINRTYHGVLRFWEQKRFFLMLLLHGFPLCICSLPTSERKLNYSRKWCFWFNILHIF